MGEFPFVLKDILTFLTLQQFLCHIWLSSRIESIEGALRWNQRKQFTAECHSLRTTFITPLYKTHPCLDHIDVNVRTLFSTAARYFCVQVVCSGWSHMPKVNIYLVIYWLFYFSTNFIYIYLRYWWRNIIYINHLFPEKELCLKWSWSTGCDMQFFALTTLFLMVYVK